MVSQFLAQWRVLAPRAFIVGMVVSIKMIIRLTRRDLFNSFLPISRLANNLNIIIGYQQSRQGLAYSLVIIN